MERPMDLTTLITRGTLRFEGAGIAGSSISAILLRSFSVAVRFQAQYGSMWACIDILIGIVLKLPLPEERGPLVKVRQGHIGTDVLVFERHNIVDGAVCGIPGRLTRPQFPAKACAEDADPRIGWFSMTSEGVTSTAMMILALPPSTT
jgi:hypothetical protein